MTHPRRHSAAPVALAVIMTLQPVGARAETKALQEFENYYVGNPGEASTIVGSSNDDVLWGDLPSIVEAHESVVRASTGYTQNQLGKFYGGNADGPSSLGSRHAAVFSPDGNRILFVSTANNIVGGFSNSKGQAYSRNLGNNKDTIALSATELGGLVPGSSATIGAVYSPDGSKVALVTNATNLAGPTDGKLQIIILDLHTGAKFIISRNRSTGAAGNGHSQNPVFSPDGTMVAFESTSTNLISQSSGNTTEIFVVKIGSSIDDNDYKTIARVSSQNNGQAANGRSFDPVFSPDGTQMAFTTAATNLTALDTDSDLDVVRKNLSPSDDETVTGLIKLISVGHDGIKDHCGATEPAYSPDGRAIAFVHQFCAAQPAKTDLREGAAALEWAGGRKPLFLLAHIERERLLQC